MINLIALEPINNLLSRKFRIPSYQRGYRWKIEQVSDLLNDLWDFHKNREQDQFYCLQPIVVVNKEGQWEVIDGQQRLTTIYLILKYFNNRLAQEYKKDLFELSYDTRPDSGEYLRHIDPDLAEKNIDYHHIHQAFEEIKQWFKTQQNIVSDFESILLNATKIIWYEVKDNSDPIEIFTRLNIGKIPLTNAELIKALFLFKENLKGEEGTKELKQFEIAGEWDRIEYALRDEEFWYFLNDGETEYENRIEFILDLMADKKGKDKDFTFRYFSSKFSTTKDSENEWRKVKNYFLTFHEWYNDRTLFHLVGFLIACKENLKQLKDESNGKAKTEFIDFLNEKVKLQVNYDLTNLTYPDDRLRLRKVFLLFNILTLLENRSSNTKFQFGRYKKEKWDIEHIHSVQSEMPSTKRHQDDWLSEVFQFTTIEEIKNRIQSYLSSKYVGINVFEELYSFIVKLYSENGNLDDVNDISNLALLDSGTNRGYQNAVFPIKRKSIIEKDKSGTFIPLCTNNVFLKYYSDSVEQMTFWGKADRECYKKAILNTLHSYVPKKQKNG